MINFLNKLIKSFLIVVPIVFNTCSTFSCISEKKIEEIFIEKVSTTDKKIFSIPFTLSNHKWNKATFSISFVDPGIKLTSDTCILNNGKGEICFEISESIQQSCSFSLNASITCMGNKSSSEYHRFNLNEMMILYVFEPEQKPQDHPYLLTPRLENVDDHNFTYRVYFPLSPDPEHKMVDLSLEPVYYPTYCKNPIYLIDNRAEIHYDKSEMRFCIDVFVHTNLSIYTTSTFLFNINIHFWNSHKEEQNYEFKNISSVFIRDINNKTMPYNFFVIETINDENVLVGLHQDLMGSESKIGLFYENLMIPPSVTKIKSNSFDYMESGISWYNNINKIIVNKSLNIVESNAFNNFPNLYQIDLTAYNDIFDFDELPEWIKNEEVIFDNSHQRDYGYIWTNTNSNLVDSMIYQRLKEKGLRDSWTCFNSSEVAPKDIYVYNSATKTIHGIHEACLDSLYRYKVLNLPSDVKKIDDNAFKALGDYPYINGSGLYETRRLILPLHIQEIGFFQNVGISGPVVFQSSQLNTINSACFQYMNSYSHMFSKDMIMSEPLILNFHNTDNLTEINQSAFAGTEIQDQITIPSNIKKIGDYAFYDNKISKIKFLGKPEEIGNEAFAHMESGNEKLSEIDLLSYGEINLNPDEPKDDQPNWIFQSKNVFKNACLPYGLIRMNLQNLSEDQKEMIKEWLFKQQLLPKDWEFVDS